MSILGYSKGSPFAGNPYIDIQSNIIDMSNTPMDLTGIDNFGNKKIMKAGRKKPYKFAGTSVREIPMQTGGIIENNKQLLDVNALAKRIAIKNGASSFLAGETFAARNVGDPVPQFVYPNGQIATPPQTLPRVLPSGVPISAVYNTSEGYGYDHPQNGNFVKVDPNIYAAYNKQKVTPAPAMNSIAKVFGKGGTNPYMSKGGLTARDVFNYLFQNDAGDYDSSDEAKESQNTAPSEEELGIDVEQQPQEPDDYEMALQLAMQQDGYQTVAGNPDLGSGQTYFAPKIRGVNPYTSQGSSNPDNPSKYAYEFFKSKGLPAHVSAGIVGNLIQESGNFRPDVITDDITGDNGASHGIAQWQGNRWPALQKWAASQGKDPKSLDTQLEYVYQEANQRGDLQKTLNATTPEEAANIFAKHYERPAYIDKNRARNARELYQQK
jgi:hypothetical protein